MVHYNETLNMIINSTRKCKKTRKMAACSHFSLSFAYVVVEPHHDSLRPSAFGVWPETCV